VLKGLELVFGEGVIMHVYMLLIVVTCILALEWLIALIYLCLIHYEK